MNVDLSADLSTGSILLTKSMAVYFKDNVPLNEQGNAKLALSIFVGINNNITSSACGKSIITNYKKCSIVFF